MTSIGLWVCDPSAKTQPVVGNLVITEVETNAGNADYVKFDPFAADISPNLKPTVTFTITDEGDPHEYQWTVYVRDTRENQWVDFVTLHGETTAPGQVTARINDPDAPGQTQTGELDDWGTYTFDVYVQEVDGGDGEFGLLDFWWYKSPYKLKIPATMPGVTDADGHPMPGHKAELVSDEQGNPQMRVSYYLHDDDGCNAHAVRAEVLDQDLEPIGSRGNLQTEVGVPHLDRDIQLSPTSPALTEAPQNYVTVLCAEDGHHADYRDHLRKRMLAVNQRPPRLVAAHRQEWQEENWQEVVLAPGLLGAVPYENQTSLALLGLPENKPKTKLMVGSDIITDQLNALQVLARLRAYDYAFTYTHGSPGDGGVWLGSSGTDPQYLSPSDITAPFGKLRFWQIQACGSSPLARTCVNERSMLHSAGFEEVMSPVAGRQGCTLLGVGFAKGAYYTFFGYIRGGATVGEAIRRTRVQLMNWLGMDLPAGHGVPDGELALVKYDLIREYGQPIRYSEIPGGTRVLLEALLGQSISDCYGWDSWRYVGRNGGDFYLWQPKGN